MVPLTGMSIDVRPRDLPIVLIGTGGGALALWADASPEIAIPAALLIMLDIRVRFWRGHV